MKTWQIVVVLLLCLALVGSMACHPFEGDKTGVGHQLVEVKRGDLRVSIRGGGNIEVSTEARLAFGSGGKIDKIYVKEGGRVSKGEVLAKLDTSALELALVQSKATHLQAKAALSKARVAVEQAKVARDQAIASRDAARASLEKANYELYNPPPVSPRPRYLVELEVKAAWSQLVAAESQLAVANLQVEIAKLEVEVAELQVKAAQQSEAHAQKQLDEAIIIAPFDGIVASVGANEGDTVLPTTKIIHLIDLTGMELKVEVNEIDIAKAKPGQRAIIKVDALPTLQLKGKVTSISPLAKKEGGVVLYKVTIGLSAPEGSGLRVGMSATADIIIDERSNVLLVPNRAIKRDSQGNPVVKVMVGKQIQERSVVIGISDDYQTEIVNGLSEGETVVIER